MIYIIFILLLILILCTSLEYFKNDNLKLLSKSELVQLLLNDTDNYYKRFTKLDLKVRNINSVDEYKDKLINIYYNYDTSEYNKLLYSINKINNIFKNYNTVGFDGNKASTIIWKIGIINDNTYENGLPHTRGDVIIISKNLLNSYRLETILLHEKIHVYQKLYPDDIQEYFSHNNFTKSRLKTDNVRANPDIDEYIYKNSSKQEMLCLYNENANSVSDVVYYPNNKIENEHPLEYMAYTIEAELNNKL